MPVNDCNWSEGDGRLLWAIISATDPERTFAKSRNANVGVRLLEMHAHADAPNSRVAKIVIVVDEREWHTEGLADDPFDT